MGRTWLMRLIVAIGIFALAAALARILLNVIRGGVAPVKLGPIPFAFDCWTSSPSGARIKIVDAAGTSLHWWDFSCDGLMALVKELEGIKKAYCDGGNANTPSGSVEDVAIDPYQDTGSNARGVRLLARHGNFFIRCSELASFIEMVQQASKNCCLE